MLNVTGIRKGDITRIATRPVRERELLYCLLLMFFYLTTFISCCCCRFQGKVKHRHPGITRETYKRPDYKVAYVTMVRVYHTLYSYVMVKCT